MLNGIPLKTVAEALEIELPEGPRDKAHDAEKPGVEDKARIDDKTPAAHNAEQKHEELSIRQAGPIFLNWRHQFSSLYRPGSLRGGALLFPVQTPLSRR